MAIQIYTPEMDRHFLKEKLRSLHEAFFEKLIVQYDDIGKQMEEYPVQKMKRAC